VPFVVPLPWVCKIVPGGIIVSVFFVLLIFYVVTKGSTAKQEAFDFCQQRNVNEKRDLVYRGMDIEIILQCFAAYSFLDDGGKKCYQDQRKYRDAIIWGAKTANERLPASFFERTSEYLIAYKKQYAVAKREGKTGDDQATDPIPLPVYKFLLRRSIQENNMFAWTWTLLQWNCMARSASIDCLGLHNIRLGPDSIIIKYDESKADKAGERLSEKNIFANPKEWKMCTWLSLGKFLFVFYFIEQCLNSSCFFSFPLADAQQRQPRCLFFLLS